MSTWMLFLVFTFYLPLTHVRMIMLGGAVWESRTLFRFRWQSYEHYFDGVGLLWRREQRRTFHRQIYQHLVHLFISSFFLLQKQFFEPPDPPPSWERRTIVSRQIRSGSNKSKISTSFHKFRRHFCSMNSDFTDVDVNVKFADSSDIEWKSSHKTQKNNRSKNLTLQTFTFSRFSNIK